MATSTDPLRESSTNTQSSNGLIFIVWKSICYVSLIMNSKVLEVEKNPRWGAQLNRNFSSAAHSS